MTSEPMMDGPLVHKLRAQDATSVTLVIVPPFGDEVNPEVWHVPTRVVAAIEAEARSQLLADLRAQVEGLMAVSLAYPKAPNDALIDHEEWCAFAYGNTTYPCHCFVSRAAVLALLEPPR